MKKNGIDENIIKQISNKIDGFLGRYNNDEDYDLYHIYGVYAFRSGFLKGDITDEVKQLIVLSSFLEYKGEWNKLSHDVSNIYDANTLKNYE